MHWIIAILIAVTWFVSDSMGQALRQRLQSGATWFEGNTLHVWLGGSVFLLILIRLAARGIMGVPASVAGSNPLMERAAT